MEQGDAAGVWMEKMAQTCEKADGSRACNAGHYTSGDMLNEWGCDDSGYDNTHGDRTDTECKRGIKACMSR